MHFRIARSRRGGNGASWKIKRRGVPMAAVTVSSSDVKWPVAGVSLAATLSWPQPCGGVVVFAHGSGSSRFSPRNRFVANNLQRAGLATLLLDLLTPEEERDDEVGGRWRFDLARLAERLTGAVDWLIPDGLAAVQAAASPPVGLFGASTGAAAALITAAARADTIRAVVCRGGRPDLAPSALPNVRCPTLLIVGEADPAVLSLNQQAAAAMTAPHHLAVIPGASHLFSEAGALEAVSALARDWFCEHFQGPAPR